VQAYGKRAPAVLDWLAVGARRGGPPDERSPGQGRVLGHRDQARAGTRARRLPGLHAQVDHRRRLSRLRARLFAAGEALYPQFATHNAHTIAAVLQLRPAGAPANSSACTAWAACSTTRRERRGRLPAVRTYAPVGAHEDLLAYLVRRLLENGANSSFVNRLLDAALPVEEVVRDPLDELDAAARHRGPRRRDVPASADPAAGRSAAREADATDRRNSRGLDFGNPPRSPR
jgi:RHH-type transcriptional regulator, proline utilization regulon repressor / proline dehydrogenase / delta 1-pyrroline-5-carboxylate dehydrogenase